MQIKLRRADKEDCEDVFNWLNDEETRRASFSSDRVSYESHCKWFDYALESPDKIIFIGENEENKKIGVVRLEKVNEKVAEFSINLSPAMRNKGYGSKLIDRACEKIALENSSLLFLARTKKDNIASIKVFRKARFFEILCYEDKNCGEILLLGRI